MDLKDAVAVITGGGSGLGEATAHEFAAGGARIVILDLPNSPGPKVAESLGEKGLFAAADVVSGEAVEAAMAAAVKRFGTIHVAVNCAGVGRAQRTVSKDGPHSLDLFSKVVQINLIGTFNVIRLAANAMSTQAPNASGERGVIINTSSVAAFEGQIGQAAYSASKAGVNGMTLPIAREFAKLGIRVMTIAPGIFDTPMLQGMSDEIRASLGAQIPFPSRLGRPDEYAALVKHIVENEVLNGEVIRLDGAIRMGAK
jgi:NAD(P)-dependent dehydrogenase (short-subunit alcohol dehydrogenase family)